MCKLVGQIQQINKLHCDDFIHPTNRFTYINECVAEQSIPYEMPLKFLLRYIL